MQLLPQQVTFPQLLTKWASILNPVLSNPTNNVSILENVGLTAGNNSIPHLLGRNLQGWYVVRMQNTYAQIYDTQSSNPYPALNLNLHSSASVVVSIAVF